MPGNDTFIQLKCLMRCRLPTSNIYSYFILLYFSISSDSNRQFEKAYNSLKAQRNFYNTVSQNSKDRKCISLLDCPLLEGNQAAHSKFEKPNGKKTKSKIFLKSVQNLCPLSHLKAL